MKRTEIQKIGEFGLIQHLQQYAVLQEPSSLLGIGDDAALIRPKAGYDVVLSTDMLVEGIHFDLIYTPLKHLGYKAVVVNLSDIYAMNAQPTQITVSVAFSNRFSLEAIDEIYQGIQTACNFYGVDLVGGDTSSTFRGLTISVTALGQVEPSRVVKRSGAKLGDLLCVTGDLGSAYMGLQILEREKQVYLANPKMQPEIKERPYLIERILKPEARRDAIEYFAQKNIIPTAMMDLSDGLSSDLIHLCRASGLGAYVEEDKLPIRNETYEQALAFNLDPTVCALHGGEDYELLFSIDPKDLDKIRYMPNLSIIGEMVALSDDITLHSKGGYIHPLKAQGWSHFS